MKHINRKGLIVGALILLCLFGFLLIAGIGFLWFRSKETTPQTHQRLLIAELTYCNTDNPKPCIVSFSHETDGNMLVNMLTSSDYPNFYLTISNGDTENKYPCQQVKDFPNNIYCTGNEMYPGETLQFKLLSNEDNTVLAEGKFAIIGLLLSTPATETTATALTTTNETVTPNTFEILTPIATNSISITSTPTALTPSYPNTSYPNSSYPNEYP